MIAAMLDINTPENVIYYLIFSIPLSFLFSQCMEGGTGLGTEVGLEICGK